MPVRFDNSGFRELEKRGREMPEVQKVEFPQQFMQKWTDFNSMEELINASGFTASEIETFQKTPNPKWEAFIQERTRFTGWNAFINKASLERLRGQFPEFKQ